MTIQNYLSYVDEMIKSTETLFAMVPADKLDWKPVDGAFTVGQQLSHLAGAIEVYANGISSGAWGFSSMRERFVKNRHTTSVTPDEALKSMRRHSETFKKLVGSLTEEEFTLGEVESPQLGRARRWRLAMLAVEHHLSHKAELFMYLKLLGVKVHTGHLYARP